MGLTSSLGLSSMANMMGLATLGSIGSSIYGANQSAKSSKQLMQKQIEWEEKRAKNAHQWEVEDLIKAGLNPILSSNGHGANTSGISPIMPDTSGYSSAGKAISENLNTGLDYVINKQNADANTITAETTQEVGESTSAKNLAEAAKTTEETKYIGGLSTSQTAKNYAEASQMTSQIEKNKAETELLQSQDDLTRQKRMTELGLSDKASQEALALIYQNIINKSEAEFVQKYGVTKDQAMKMLQTGTSGLSNIIGNAVRRPSKVHSAKNYTTIKNYK